MSRPLEFHLEEQQLDGSVVLRPVGELDVSSAPAVRERLVECLRRAAGALLVVDCERLSFLDSSGLSLLTYAKVRMEESGGSLRLARLAPRLDRVVELAGLSGLLARFASIEEALAPPGSPAAS